MSGQQTDPTSSTLGTDRVAVTALVVSLVALLTTVGQLLQQYFATADGYRRCQASVMGHWAQRTRLRWRWRQFRFETLYTVPEIFIAKGGVFARENEVLILGDTTSRQLSLAPPAAIWNQDTESAVTNITGSNPGVKLGGTVKPQKRNGDLRSSKRAVLLSPDLLHSHSDELVSWLPLLHWLHEGTRASFESVGIPRPSFVGDTTPDALLTWRTFPALVMQERSWDFQPPDVIRPLAKTTVSTIAILARRMGMRWKDFRPEEGILRAEGHSHIITSTVVRSLGLVLQYNYTGRSKRLARESPWRAAVAGSVYKENEEIYISTPGADRFGAGVIRGHRRLGVPDFTVGTQQEIVTSLRTLDQTEICFEILKKILKQDAAFKFPVADLVAMTSFMICQAGSPLVQIPAPSDNMDGITAGPHGRRIFTHALDVYVREMEGPTLESQTVDWGQTQVGRQTCWVLWRLKELQENFPHQFDAQEEYYDGWIVRRPVDYLQALNKIFDEASQFLQSSGKSNLSYTGLLQAHLVAAVFDRDIVEEESAPTNGSESKIAKLISAGPGMLIGRYFSALPQIVKFLQHGSSPVPDGKLIVDFWMTMMLRAICWGASHYFVPGERVPIAYFGSQLPVYIG